MKFFDEHFKDNKIKYVLQCGLATVIVLGVLVALRTLGETVIVAALGASSFIAFTMPHKEVSQPRLLIGGYIVGMLMGSGCHFLSNHYLLTHIAFINQYSHQIFGSIAVGSAMFVMAITETEHPPAAGIALGFVLNGWNLVEVEVIIAGIAMITVLKLFLKRFLINLV